MKWSEIRQIYPERQWMVLEILASHMESNRYLLDDVTVAEICPDSAVAFQTYRRLRQQYPARQFVFMCTDRETLDMEILPSIGVRRLHAARTEG